MAATECPLVVGLVPDGVPVTASSFSLVACDSPLVVDGDTAVCGLGHRWLRCRCGEKWCCGWALEGHANPPTFLR